LIFSDLAALFCKIQFIQLQNSVNSIAAVSSFIAAVSSSKTNVSQITLKIKFCKIPQENNVHSFFEKNTNL